MIEVEAEINDETLSFSIKYDIEKCIKKKTMNVKHTTEMARNLDLKSLLILCN